MSFSDKKEKSPEDELVDYLVGVTRRSSDNLREVLSDNIKRGELEDAVKKVWKNGGSLEEIQRVYDENLARLKFLSENKGSPEEKLVDKLVGSDTSGSDNLKKVLNSSILRKELQNIVQGEWVNGASVSEIRKVYVENLIRLKSLPENKEPESLPLSKNVGFILITLIIGGLIVGGIYGIFFLPVTTYSFNEFVTDGVAFNIPTDYELNGTGENGDAFFTKYVYEYTTSYGEKSENSITKYRYIEIYVYKNKSVQQIVSNISSDGWNVHNASYGNYQGYRLERPLFEGCWFIFVKDGKTVGVYCDTKYARENMKGIIS